MTWRSLRTSSPSERSEASALSLATGNLRCARIRSISWPTMPVAPTTATFNVRWEEHMRESVPPGPADSVKIEQFFQTAVEARLLRHLADGQQHAGREGLTAGGPMGQGQGLPRQPEEHLLVGDQSREPDRVDRDVP